ncbi:deoxyribose-phosphate aldolase [uncultured Oscillibacter sp.]|uniref:deoxyribose-phosphate aldolase n=1 Tax=uncultured Oscillibacter sp. TaxID=876091 RepID=UPI0025DB7954|nr:deoxyribose-phosphate aldolase [uncultured Oscillibacter sp.]
MGKYEIITQEDFTPQEIAAFIDHSLLFAYTTPQEIVAFCDDIKRYGFRVGCVNSVHTELAVRELKGYDVTVATTIGYPWGTVPYELKAKEAVYAMEKGARAIDFVISVGHAVGGDWDYLRREMAAMVKVTHERDVPVKAILETCYLSDEQKVQACRAAQEEGVDFVKTSTGFGSGWCNVHDVKLMKETVGTQTAVKASGKITDYRTAVELIHAGATRLGTRAGVEVLRSTPGFSE